METKPVSFALHALFSHRTQAPLDFFCGRRGGAARGPLRPLGVAGDGPGRANRRPLAAKSNKSSGLDVSKRLKQKRDQWFEGFKAVGFGGQDDNCDR